MKLKLFSLSAILFLTFGVGEVILVNFSSEKVTEVEAYTTSSLPSTINLNDLPKEDIRTYYSSLLSLSSNERSGANLLKNLKQILKNGQKYLSYDTDSKGKRIWQAYEIVDRDWVKSPASDISGYNSTTNTISNYSYGTSVSSPGSNPFIHALYVNRNIDNQMHAWVNLNTSNSSHGENAEWNIDREHIWPKSHGFENDGEGGARGDLMHLWPGDSYVNSETHNNYYYGYVDTSRSYTNSKTKYEYADGNLKGYSLTLGGNTTVFEPQDSDKGDIARAVFYMAARYNYLSGSDSDGIDTNNPNLEIVNTLSTYSNSGYMSSTSTTGKLGILQDLLEWNRLDPPDEFEIHRNNLLYRNFTNNRNPFIDFPEWAEYIWGKSTNGSYNSSSTGYADPTNNLINDFASNSGSVIISQDSASIKVGETVTLTAQASDSSTITWSSSDSSIASVSNGVVNGVAAGNTTITASATIGGKTYSKTCSVTVTASAVPNTGDAKLYSGSIEEGDYVIYFGGKAINTTISNNRIQYESVSPLDNKITDSNESTIWHISSNGDYWSIYNASVSKYLASNGTKNQIQLIDDKNDDKAKWNISGIETYEFINKYNYENEVKSSENIAAYLRNNSTYGFACYSNTIGGPLTLYRIRELSSISASGQNTEFTKGDKFSFGGTVTATYSDGSTKNVTESASFSGYDMQKTGMQTVTVTYSEDGITKTATYQITVNEPPVTLSSIAITTQPTKTEYEIDEELDTTGMVVTATYSNNSTEPVTGWALSDFDSSTAGEKNITVTYNGKTTTLTVTVLAAPVLESISLNVANAKTTYEYNEDLDTSNVVVTAHYDRSEKDHEVSIADCTVTGYSKTTEGEQTITVTYQEKTATYKVTVKEKAPELQSLVLDTTNTKLVYEVDEEADFAGLVVKAHYDKCDDVTLTADDYKITGFDSSAAGKVTITVSYNGVTKTFEITVNEPVTPPQPVKTLSSIAITTPPAKLNYYVGDELDTTGMVVIATYSDQSTETVTGWTTTGFDSSTAGKVNVTVTYEGQTTTFEVTIKEAPQPEKTLTSIAVTTMPTKTQYDIGETFDKSGLVVTATYSDGSTEIIDDYKLSTPDMTTTGEKTIIVTYKDVSTTFTITVAKSLSSISVNGQTTEFTKGDTFSFGGTVTATYTDGSTLDVTSSVTFSGYDMSKAGVQTVTVTYVEGDVRKTVTYQITVNEPVVPVTLTGISITTNPTKLEYVTGEDLDLTGMVVTATYSDGSTSLVNDYTVSGYDKNNIGTQTITVTYQGFTKTFTVVVNDGLKDQKDAAVAALNEYYNSLDLSKYSFDNLVKLYSELKAGESAIKNAKSVDEINAALANAKNVLASIPQEETPEPPTAPTNTCGGNIATTSAILSLLALLGVALVTYKKRKQ